MPYRPIGDYAVIGDLHTAALVGCDGSIDWCCLPRFDSMSIFAALLDDARGGRWRIAPDGAWTSEQHYLAGTNVLQTEFRTAGGGVLMLTDHMPVGPSRGRHSEIVRRARCVRGAVDVAIHWEPRFDYARSPAQLDRRAAGVLATDRDNDVATVASTALVDWTVVGDAALARVALAAGEECWCVMRWDDDEVRPVDAGREEERLAATVAWWDAWSGRLRNEGPYRKEVERSALALKLCCYEPTGAIIAAPTTSLPESPVGGRTWDYRYAWLRDAAFVLYALESLGSTEETDAFIDFLKRVCRREDDRHVQIMYAVDGARDLPEQVLDHLEGWRGIGPVRIGNGAAGQFQLDVYGEVLLTAAAWHRYRPMTEGTWRAVQGLVAFTADHWRDPDSSIWEPRVGARHHVFSKIMAWAALDRGALMAAELGKADVAARWAAEAEAVRAEVLERGWDPQRRTFVQAYDAPELDAAVLVVPKVRFLPRNDERVRWTLEAVRRELATPCEDLIYRYRGHDGLGGQEGAFVFSSLWMIQNVALTGDLAEAERLFRLLLHRANPVGLLAEEIDPMTGEQLGNFPQALSHAALINTAYILERLQAPHDGTEPSASWD